jgi:membrane protein implicated in regulation of membrane protease activity
VKGDRRIRDLGALLPLGGLALLLPPYLSIFDRPVFIAGVPLLPAYIFTAWMIGIVLAAIVSRRFLQSQGDDTDDEI